MRYEYWMKSINTGIENKTWKMENENKQKRRNNRREKKQMKRKILAVMLACTAAVGMAPVDVLAAEEGNQEPVMAELYVSPSGSPDAS